MYCSSCGAEASHNLIYCKHCGAKLSGGDGDKALEMSPNILVCAMVVTFVIGMAAIITGATGMKKYGFDEGMINAFLLFSFLLMLALEGVFVGLLFSRRKVQKEVSDINQLNEQEKKALYAAPARGFTESVRSVTEQTTNPLEPIYRDQKSKRT